MYCHDSSPLLSDHDRLGRAENKHTVETTYHRLTATSSSNDEFNVGVCACDILNVIMNVCAEVGRGSPAVTELED